jgi:hypothetical protein
MARAPVGVEARGRGAVKEALAILVAQEVARGPLQKSRTAGFGPEEAEL